MSEALDPSGTSVNVGNVIVRTPGLSGEAEYYAGAGPGRRGPQPPEPLSTQEFDAALREAGVQEQETVQISDAEEATVPGGTRAVPNQRTLELEVDAPPAGRGQFVIHQDEAGVITWSFAPPSTAGVRGAARRTYVIRTNQPPEEARQGTRGLTAILGNKVLRVLLFPLIDPVVGEVSELFVRRWEDHYRPHRTRTFTPETYLGPPAADDRVDWSKLGEDRSLLMIHGTGSQAHTGFAGLPRNYLEDLHQAYGRRVFALDHPTIATTPQQNIEWFLKQVPDGTSLNLDIVCHSRGGLVARVLAEKQGEFSLGSRKVRVNKIIFVGAPNAGTTLTDTKYMSDYLDSYTNLLNFFPDTAVLDTIQAVFAVAKQLAVGAFKGLDGLQSMRPNGQFLQWLNVAGGTRDPAGPRYYALASNYDPIQPGLKLWAENRLLDDIFKADNDMVVPTLGVYDENGASWLPIDEHFVFPKEQGVPHSGYFANEDARQRITDWLSRN